MHAVTTQGKKESKVWTKLKCKVLRRTLRQAQRTMAGLRRRLLDAEFQAVGADHVKRIPSWTTEEELNALYNLAASCTRGSVALEVGSYLGASSCYLAAGLKLQSGILYCVDTWENQTMPEGLQDTFGQFQRNISPFADVITAVRKRSEELKRSDVNAPLDLVFIDGDHSFRAVSIDFAITSKWVREGGIIAFHDVGNPDYPGVSCVVGAAIASGGWVPVGACKSLLWIKKLRPSRNCHLTLGADI